MSSPKRATVSLGDYHDHRLGPIPVAAGNDNCYFLIIAEDDSKYNVVAQNDRKTAFAWKDSYQNYSKVNYVNIEISGNDDANHSPNHFELNSIKSVESRGDDNQVVPANTGAESEIDQFTGSKRLPTPVVAPDEAAYYLTVVHDILGYLVLTPNATRLLAVPILVHNITFTQRLSHKTAHTVRTKNKFPSKPIKEIFSSEETKQEMSNLCESHCNDISKEKSKMVDQNIDIGSDDEEKDCLQDNELDSKIFVASTNGSSEVADENSSGKYDRDQLCTTNRAHQEDSHQIRIGPK
ncbi:uncharacterized protein ASCRUDRAFT_8838 [Ascoidea rubescens DSM 1968]|uniref:Uncharacterized protein n=1 Tax=Ascoidea rubescens DSM 1968 TaxID=1344418 RepID=A0A1D2VEX7_9ASCO|nr:hypothetical protein ASCRUDRAFT_8838 [Ascoidea rubescens DSM 1968]ODV60063.1 hypothetical protein ASCRUDRAFT_8838 [Ascoidea rubescens DSM 1968]